MSKPKTAEDIDKMILECPHVNTGMGIPVCKEAVLPCVRAIQRGECLAVKEDENDR